jgi:TATA-binding related factor (TRF) of subunit 20 of Mediator complex
MEMGGSFTEILARMDTGWQERQGTNVVLEGRGFEWGRDWRIWCANLKQANRYRGVVVEVVPEGSLIKVQYLPSTSLPQSKLILTQFAERHIFRTGEAVRPFWAKRVYPVQPAEESPEKDFEEWHTAMQYIELIQYVSLGRRRSVVE